MGNGRRQLSPEDQEIVKAVRARLARNDPPRHSGPYTPEETAQFQAFRARVKARAQTDEEQLADLRAVGIEVDAVEELVPTTEEQDRREHRTGVAPRRRLLEKIGEAQRAAHEKRVKDREQARRAREGKAKLRAEGRGGADITRTEISDARLRKLIDRYGAELSDRALHREIQEKGYRVGRPRLARLRRMR